MNILDINNTLFTIWGYQMSYIEFFGTLFTIWCVWLTAKAKVLSWPVGIIGTVLYLFLFYQIQLYSDLFEQIYFLLTGIWGWWMWLHPRTASETDHKQHLKISLNGQKENIIYLLLLIIGTAFLTYITKNLNIWLPQYFSEPAAFPFLDAFTTSMSFLAQWLLMKKKIESWILWILVDAIGIGLYWSKGVKFVSIEYLLFFFLAIFGLVGWLKIYKNLKISQ
jgi:nicotinamide mononucleotide transporter